MAPISPAHRRGCARLGFARLKAFRLNVYEATWSTLVNGAWAGYPHTSPGTGLRIDGASIDQVLNDQVDTASFRMRGIVPVAGQVLDVYSGDTDATHKIFGGRIIATTQLYESRKQNRAHDVRCVDPTWLMNRRVVLANYVGLQAFDVIGDVIGKFARGVIFSSQYVTLPRIPANIIDEITFTNEYVPVCLTTICERVGAHWYIDYQNYLHVFTDEQPDANTITDAAPHTAADLQLTEDLSQVITKVIGRGGGARCSIDTPVGATELPVDEDQETWYSTTGGLVETGTQVIAYAGVKGRGGKGSFVGTGNAPAAAPLPAPFGGSSYVVGATYQYGATFTTATGETMIGPLGSIKITTITMGTPPMPSARSRGAGAYPPGFITPGATSMQFRLQIVYRGGAVGPLGSPSGAHAWDGNDWEVGIGPRSYYTAPDGTSAFYYPALEPSGPAAPTNYVIVYRSDNGGAWQQASTDSFYNSSTGYVYQCACSTSTGGTLAPSGFGSVQVQQIPRGAAAGITGRKLYRTTANGATVKLLASIANNVDTSYVDVIADGALGVSPPASDTSGVKDEGQVLPGATTLPVASVQPFVDDVGPSGGGGWIRVGTMPVKYTGIAGGALTGIPASGNGSISAATRHGTQVLVQPRLYGIPASGTGAIVAAIARGDTITIRIEKTDTAAVNYMAERLKLPGTAAVQADGVIEFVVSDSRFDLVELQDHVDATLLDRKDPQRTLRFTSRDLSLQVGRLITVTTSEPPIAGTFRIHRIALSEIAIAGGRATAQPLKTVEASSRIYKFTDLLRRLRSVEAGVR